MKEVRIFERWVKTFKKEEEFLDEYADLASVAADFLDREWIPCETADDVLRETLKYYYSTKQVRELNFDSADIYHLDNRFSSAQIVLKSSYRLVTIKVSLIGDQLIAEKIVDKSLS